MVKRVYILLFFYLVTLFFTITAYSMEQSSIAENLICQNRLEEANRVVWTDLRKNGLTTNNSELINNFNTLVELKILKGEPDSALIYSRKCLRLSSQITDSLILTRAWCAIGSAYGINERFDSCVFYSFKAINYGKVHNNINVLIKGYTTLGVMQNVVGDYAKALSYFQKVRTLSITGNNGSYLEYSLYNIGYTYVRQKNYKEALQYFEEAEMASKVSGNYKLLVYIYCAASDCYCYLGDRSKWKEYYEMACSLSESFGDKRTQLVVLRSLINDALKNSKNESVIKYCLEALNILNDYTYPSFKAEISYMLRLAYNPSDEFSSASNVYEDKNMSGNSQTQKSSQLSVAEFVPVDYRVDSQNLFGWNKYSGFRYFLLLIITVVFLIVIFKRYWDRAGLLGNVGFNSFFNHRLGWSGVDNEIITTSQQLPKEKLIDSDSINNRNIDEKYRLLFEEFERIVSSNKLYLDYNLTQKDVIRFLGTNRKYFYLAVSQNSNNNFKRLLNNLRIQEAKRIIEERVKTDPNLTLMDIYSLCGFASNESFYRVFKSLVDHTPGQYANEYLNEIRKQCTFICTPGIPCSVGIFQTNCRFFSDKIL